MSQEIMSRFANRYGKCKTPEQLDTLCKTYMQFRENEKNKVNPLFPLQNYNTAMIGGRVVEFRTFVAQTEVPDMILAHGVVASQIKAATLAPMYDQIYDNIVSADFFTVDETKNLAKNSIAYRVSLGVIKP